MRREGARVDVDRVAADRLDDRDAGRGESLAEAADLADAEREVVVVEHLAQTDRHRLEVAAGEAAVGREALDQDELVLQRLDPGLVAQREEAAHVGETVLLGAHRAAVGESEDLAHDLRDGAAVLSRLALPDEPGVLGEAAGVDEERDVVPAADVSRCRARSRARPAGPPPELLVSVSITSGHAAAVLREAAVEPAEVHVPLEGVPAPRVPAPRG